MRLLVSYLLTAVLAAVPARAQREIAYDDGTAERGIVYNERGNGLAVRFSAAPGSILLGARFFIAWAPFWNPLGVSVLRANGPGDAPGDTLAGYFEERLDSRSRFKDVAFPAPVALPGDFYVVYLQTGGGSGDSNVFGIDTSSPPDGRSWRFQNRAWTLMAPEEGDVMIRTILSGRTPIAPSRWEEIKRLYR